MPLLQKTLVLWLALSSFPAFSQTADFKTQQLLNPRVKAAYDNKNALLKKMVSEKGLSLTTLQLFIRVFKKEHELEVWAKDASHPAFVLLQTYPICYFSGDLGPKRKEGDLQVPEGFYHIAGYNPNATYHLTLWVDYPNASDRILSDKKTPGGEICIHGKCVSIGCMPMTDDKIEEIYLLCIEAHSHGQTQIPTHIFPGRLDEKSYTKLKEEYADNKILLAFWANLKPGYDFFEKNKTLPRITADATGKYVIK